MNEASTTVTRDNMPSMRRLRLRGLTIKAALALGFGATFGLWLFAGYYFMERMADLQEQSAEVNDRYMQAQELLSSVRTEVLMGSVYVRDALLDPDPQALETYRTQVQETYREVDRALQRYVPILNDQVERERVAGLRREIDGFRATLLEVLRSDRRRWRDDARLILGRIMPRRTSVLRVSDEVQALNRIAYIQQQQAVADIYRATQRRVWESLGFALAASLAIALLATLYVGRLERDLQQQRLRELQTTDDLQRLSSKLVSAQEEERRTIARELHDELGQVLQAIKMEIALAKRTIEASGGSGKLLDDAQSIADGALHTVRDLSHLLHPALLDDLGLAAAVNWYLGGFGKRHGIEVELLQEGMERRLQSETEAAAYRIVQEALTNVAKHARATLAFVYLQQRDDVILIRIEDNGIGFEPGRARRGLGLIGIRERVAHLRGSVRVDSAPGKGTRLTVELPARARAAAAETAEFDSQDGTHAPVTTSEVLLG